MMIYYYPKRNQLATTRRHHDDDMPAHTHSHLDSGRMLKKRNLSFSDEETEENAPQQHGSSASKKMRRTPKVVRFAESDMVTYRSYTQDDLRSAWYDQAEYEAFKEECRDAIRHLDSLNYNFQLIDHSKYCIRGLEEQITPDVYYAKKHRKDSFLKAILREQQLHIKLGIYEPESLKAISMVQSRQSRDWALELGVLDSTFEEE